jgi:hypothetical protein
MARTYIDELKDGIRFSSGGPVSISLETAKRLCRLCEASKRNPWNYDRELGELYETIPEPMPEPKP